ncbi:MAG TPA: radical SAM/SPASM domain-containing protein, partial [Elusimicrobia bacterium]|nr:radical SAM/SPASM domain-containing protein [Elusimicrobiota bacterium]
MEKFLPKLIAWEVTRSCMLNCLHCRAAARYGRDPNELTTEECFRFLDDVKSFSNPIIILTGGEPMLREDIFEIATYGAKKGGNHLLGLTMVMAPCGMLVNEETAKKIVDSGIKRISLSLDGATAETHDTFRGVKGSYETLLKAMDYAKKVGLEFQVNTTVTKHNLKELPQILQLAMEKGAVGFHPFLLVPTGRGKELTEWELSAEEYEKTLTWVYEKDKELEEKKIKFQFKPTCAPHYYRIYRQHEAKRIAQSPNHPITPAFVKTSSCAKATEDR